MGGESVRRLGSFQGNGTPVPKFHKSDCAHLKDNMDIRQESVKCESPITTLFHDMIVDDPTRRFLFQVDFRHCASVSMDKHFMYWLCDCLHRFEGRL